MVLSCFQTNQHNVAWRHINCTVIGLNGQNIKIPVYRVNAKPVFGNLLIILVEKEVNIMTGVGQFPSIKTADGTTTNDGVV